MEVCEERNIIMMKKLLKMNDKDNCQDIFKNCRVEQKGEFKRMYEKKTNKRYYRDKISKINLTL